MIPSIIIKHPIQLKIAGLLPNTSLKQLDSLSLSNKSQLDYIKRANFGCGNPDKPDIQIASSTVKDLYNRYKNLYSEEELSTSIGMHQTMHNATGKGSWPHDCHLNLYPHSGYHCAPRS